MSLHPWLHRFTLLALVAGCGPASSADDSASESDATPSSDATGPTGEPGDSVDPQCLDAPPPGDQDPDLDGLPTACDACPLSSKTGAVPDENCCDPRIDTCARWSMQANLSFGCLPDHTGVRFDCETTISHCNDQYRHTCNDNGCLWAAPCLPPNALLNVAGCPEDSFKCDCTLYSCNSKWCTIGDDLPCEAGMGCLPWFGPGEAPPGMQDLGVCTRLDEGPCAGKLGRECTLLFPNTG